MSISKLDLERIRRFFPVVKKFIYFNHAATGPLPTLAVREIGKFCRISANEGCVPYSVAEKVTEETRELSARLMGVEVEEVAFVRNTSEGILMSIGLIPWEKDDNMIMMSDAFPANSYPYHFLLPGIEKRFISSVELSNGSECITRLVDKNTRAVAIDWVHFLSGSRFDIATISNFCQKRNIYLIIDAIQGLGAVAEDFGRISADFVVAGGGKWLLAPQGIGLLYINKRIMPSLKPFHLGWLSCDWEDFNEVLRPRSLKKYAKRYEEGTKNYIGIYGLRAAVKLLLDIGIENVSERVFTLTELLREMLKDMGFELLTPEKKEKRAGIITCRKNGRDMVQLQKKLEEVGCICSVRQNWLRISPHFYNTEEEIERFIEKVRMFSE